MLAQDTNDTAGPIAVDWPWTRHNHAGHRAALSRDTVMHIRRWERDRSLRELAAEYGVSHETIRKARGS